MKNYKKNPKHQLDKYSVIFMQLGLVLTLFIVFVTIEYESKKTSILIPESIETETIRVFDDRPLAIVKEAPKKKIIKPKPTIKLLDKVVKGNNDIIQLPFDKPTEDIIDVIDIDDIKTEDELDLNIDKEDVSFFILIEDAPIFRGCEGLSKEENKKCFDKKMKNFIIRKFDTELAQDLGLREGKHKIISQFIIDKKGEVKDVKIRAPHPRLMKEVNSILKTLPKFTPGKQRNRPVKVRYTIPITFKVN